MSLVCEAFALVLVANLAAGMLRVLRGPRPADRMLAAQMLGTTGVALLLVLAQLQGIPALRHVALVFALLALLAVLVFARRIGSQDRGSDGAG